MTSPKTINIIGNALRKRPAWSADVAQQVERVLGKDEVTGSSPVISSIKEKTRIVYACFFFNQTLADNVLACFSKLGALVWLCQTWRKQVLCTCIRTKTTLFYVLIYFIYIDKTNKTSFRGPAIYSHLSQQHTFIILLKLLLLIPFYMI